MMRKKIEEETSVRVKLPPVGKEGVVGEKGWVGL